MINKNNGDMRNPGSSINPGQGLVPFPRRAYQSLGGKDVRQVPSNFTKNPLFEQDDNILTINCMNCQELISLDKIEEHSNICTTITEAVREVETGTSLAQNIFKLKKLEGCLNELNKNPGMRPGDKNYISILLRLCQKLCLDPLIDQSDPVLKSLSSLLLTFKGSLSIRIYADRLNSLALQQKAAFQEIEIETTREQLETMRCSSVNKQSEPKVSIKDRLRIIIPEQIFDNKKVEEITSELGSLRSQRSESSFTSVVEEEKTEVEEELILASTDDKQMQFYGMCLSIKLQISEQNKMHNISILKLYQEVVKKEIPKDLWTSFIIEQLKDPRNCCELERTRRRAKSRPVPKKLHCFEAIIEEENP